MTLRSRRQRCRFCRRRRPTTASPAPTTTRIRSRAAPTPLCPLPPSLLCGLPPASRATCCSAASRPSSATAASSFVFRPSACAPRFRHPPRRSPPLPPPPTTTPGPATLPSPRRRSPARRRVAPRCRAASRCSSRRNRCLCTPCSTLPSPRLHKTQPPNTTRTSCVAAWSPARSGSSALAHRPPSSPSPRRTWLTTCARPSCSNMPTLLAAPLTPPT